MLSDLLGLKLKTTTKIVQFNSRLASKLNTTKIAPPLTTNISLDDHWLVGFIMGSYGGSFQIQINDRSKFNLSTQVVVCVQITQKDCAVLKALKNTCGGVLYYVKAQKYIFYSTSSLKNSNYLTYYLDKFNLIGRSYKIYQIWRKVLTLVINKQHLTQRGLEQIVVMKAKR